MIEHTTMSEQFQTPIKKS